MTLAPCCRSRSGGSPSGGREPSIGGARLRLPGHAARRAARRPVARGALALAFAVLAGAAAPAAAQELTLRNAWMRPSPAGADAARAYVDIDSRAALSLVGASTPAAKRVAIVRTKTINDPATEEVVASLPVRAGGTTRLAYRGDHLRFLNVQEDLANGMRVPLTLVFRDAAGREVRASTDVVVRGLLLPQHMPPKSRDAPGGAPYPPPATLPPPTGPAKAPGM